MATHNSNQYTDFTNVSVGKTTGTGIYRFGSQLSSALTASGDRAIYVRSDGLKYWNGTAETDITSGGSGVSTWDGLYDLDKTLTIDDTTLTFALTHATNNGLTLTGTGNAGHVLQITNAGTGKDINGTSNTWSISAAGALLVTSIADSATNGDLAIDGNGTGKVTIAGTSTGVIELQSDITSAASKSFTMAGVGGSDMFIMTAGDAVLSDGSLTMTDADNAASFALTNNTITTANLATITSTSLTTGHGILMTVNGLTNGFMFKGVTTAAGLGTGGFISYDDGTERFSVKADGATTIASGVNSTVALKVTGIQTSEDMVELTSSGVTASGNGVLLINSSGNSASGSAQIRIAPSGTPVEGSIGIQFVGGSKVMKGLDIASDAATNSANILAGNGVRSADTAVLMVSANVSASNADSAVIRVHQDHATGVATNLALVQDDVDIPFITFETTVGVGNAIEAVGGKTLTTTHFVMVDIEGVGSRYFPVGTIA